MEENRTNRFSWTGKDGDQPIFITNDQLQCRDCVHCMKAVAECEKYEEKPGYVLSGVRPCPHYEQNRA